VQLALGGEVVVEHRRRDVRTAGDLLHRRPGITLRGEDLGGGALNDLSTGSGGQPAL